MENAVIENQIMRRIWVIRGLIQHRREVVEGAAVKPYRPKSRWELIIQVHKHHVLEKDIPSIAVNVKSVNLAVLNQCGVDVVVSEHPFVNRLDDAKFLLIAIE